jgi:hypothetical protein
VNLQQIQIRDFRSISNATLPSVGRFNVLIGKNNTGKSNLLSSIVQFFRFMANGDVVAAEGFGNKTLDFHRGTAESHLIFTFGLDAAERASLISSLTSQSPQVKNAAESLPATLQLGCHLTIRRRPSPLAYLSEVYLSSPGAADQSAIPLLKLTEPAVGELAKRQLHVQQVRQTVAVLSKVATAFDEEWWTRYREEHTSGRRVRGSEPATAPPLRYYLRHLTEDEDLPDQAVAFLEQLIREEKSYAGFQKAVREYVRSQDDEQSARYRAPLNTTLVTFAGNEVFVPKYVQELVTAIGATRVHYLTDRRAPIGKKEAKRRAIALNSVKLGGLGQAA